MRIHFKTSQEFGGHCFCIEDTDGNLSCCRCDATIMSCDSCPVSFCVMRNELQAIPSASVYMFNCPVASKSYIVSYKRKELV